MQGQNEMSTRETDAGSITIDRKIPLWGIVAFCGSLVASSYSLYSGYVAMANSVDKLTASVERIRESQTASQMKDIQHDNAIQTNQQAITDLKRDVEELKRNQRWAPGVNR